MTNETVRVCVDVPEWLSERCMERAEIEDETLADVVFAALLFYGQRTPWVAELRAKYRQEGAKS